MIFRASEIPGFRAKLKRQFRPMMVTFLKFIISVTGGHCDYSLRAPEILATPLTTNSKSLSFIILELISNISCGFVDVFLY